jgi:hypothetical protein
MSCADPQPMLFYTDIYFKKAFGIRTTFVYFLGINNKMGAVGLD